jgi:hypothetical protein
MNYRTICSALLLIFLGSSCSESNQGNSPFSPKYYEIKDPRTFLIDDSRPKFLPDAVDTNCGAIWEYLTYRKNQWLPKRTKYYELPKNSSEEIHLPGRRDAYMTIYGGTTDNEWHYLIYNHMNSGSMNSTPWTISSWNRSTKSVAHLDHQDYGPVPSLSADNGYLAYSAFYNSGLESNDLGIFLTKADGSQKRRLIEPESGAVSLVWPYAFVLKKIDSATTEASQSAQTIDNSENQFRLLRINVVNGQRLEIPGLSAGRATFSANHQNLFIGRPDRSVDIADLSGNVLMNYPIPNNQHIGMARPLDDGFLFLGEDSETRLAFSAILVSYQKTWRLIYLSRQVADSTTNVGQNIVGHGRCVYWIDERLSMPSPEKDKGDLFARRIHHYGFVEEIIKEASPIVALSK